APLGSCAVRRLRSLGLHPSHRRGDRRRWHPVARPSAGHGARTRRASVRADAAVAPTPRRPGLVQRRQARNLRALGAVLGARVRCCGRAGREGVQTGRAPGCDQAVRVVGVVHEQPLRGVVRELATPSGVPDARLPRHDLRHGRHVRGLPPAVRQRHHAVGPGPDGRALQAGGRALRGAHHQAPRRLRPVAEQDSQSASTRVAGTTRHRGGPEHGRPRRRSSDGALLLGRSRLDVRAGADHQLRVDARLRSPGLCLRAVRGGSGARAHRPVPAERPVERHLVAAGEQSRRAVRRLLQPRPRRGGEQPVHLQRGRVRAARRRGGRPASAALRFHHSRVRGGVEGPPHQVGGDAGDRALVRLQPDRGRGSLPLGRRARRLVRGHREQERQSPAQRRPGGRREHQRGATRAARGTRGVARGERRRHLRYAAVGAGRGDGHRRDGPHLTRALHSERRRGVRGAARHAARAPGNDPDARARRCGSPGAGDAARHRRAARGGTGGGSRAHGDAAGCARAVGGARAPDSAGGGQGAV
ncbi:MAG: GH29, partial [uncultured Gemmatimonadaceae bacterium]